MTGGPQQPAPRAAANLGPAWPERAAWGTAGSLRAWQQAALNDYLQRNPHGYTCHWLRD